MRGLILLATLLLAALAAPPALAQSGGARPAFGDWLGPLEIRYERAAVAGHPIVALLPGDGCVVGGSGQAAIDPARTVISRVSNAVTIDLYSMAPACFSVEPLGLWVYRQPLGVLEAGNYQVTVRYRYHDVGNGAPFATLTAPLSVTGGAVALDARSWWSVAALVLALAAFGGVARRRRRA